MIQLIKAIDAHVEGQSLRLATEGMPTPSGSTMRRKQQWMARHADHLRRALVLEPRGHMNLCAAVMTEAVSPGSHAGLLFMHNDGYASLSGHGLIGAVTIALERGLLFDSSLTESDHRVFAIDTVAGTLRARARIVDRGGQHRVDTVAFANVPAFVSAPGQTLRLGNRDVHVDVAFGGLFFAIVDAESVGLSLDSACFPELGRAAKGITRALDDSPAVRHPLDSEQSGLHGVIFTGPPRDPEAHLRNLTIFADGAMNRSPSGTGTSAVMAVSDAMGLLPMEQVFVHESVTGSLFRGRITDRTQVGELPAIATEIEGSAWITGEHTFLIDDEDPLKEGIRL